MDEILGTHRVFELICCDCRDHPYLDYSQVPPRLQQLRGPYTKDEGIAAFAQHLGLVADDAQLADTRH